MSNWLKHRIDVLMKMPGISVRMWKLPFIKFPLIFTESESCSVMSNSLWPHGLYNPWNSPGQNTGVGSCSLLQGIFPTQGSNPGFLHYRQTLYQQSHQGSPRILEGSLFLLQWIFLTQESNQGLLHCRWILYKLSYLGIPVPPKKDLKWDSKDWTVTSNKNASQDTVQEYLQEYRNYSWSSYYWWKDGWNGLNFK